MRRSRHPHGGYPWVMSVATHVTSVARDAAYVVVGLAVLGTNAVQVQRREIERRLATGVPGPLGALLRRDS